MPFTNKLGSNLMTPDPNAGFQKKKSILRNNQLVSHKINFQSDDSEASNVSYESSFESDDDAQLDNVEYFKEEMTRFFINYPELVNNKILAQSNIDETNSGETNGYWKFFASEILDEAKESSTSLESLAKRIAHYRYKASRTDLIDLLLAERTNIMQRIDVEISKKKKESTGNKVDHEADKNTFESNDNPYYSWRKRKEMETKTRLKSTHRAANATPKNQDNIKSEVVKKFHQSLQKNVGQRSSFITAMFSHDHKGVLKEKLQATKNQETPKKKKNPSFIKENPRNGKENVRSPKEKFLSKFKNSRQSPLKMEEPHRSKNQGYEEEHHTHQPYQNFWKHLVNFQPKTQGGKQLCEQIRRNNPHDELGIKKTIMNFLVKNKENFDREVVNKSTITQKIQKLYSQDSKELLMFYPLKKTQKKEETAQFKRDSFLDSQTKEGFGADKSSFGKFLELLKEISEGPLIKYWKQMQENKL